MIRWLAIAFLLAGCNGAKLQSGDYADALTTVHVIASPKYIELNKTLPDDPITGPLVLLVQKYVIKAGLIEAGMEPDLANRSANSFSWYWACQNLALFAGVEPVGRGVFGVLCAVVSFQEGNDEY